MKEFDQLIKEDVAAYEGRYDHLIYQAPALYRLFTHLLDDPNLPGKLRPISIAAIAYFILPVDIILEELHSPVSYVDDIFLCAFIANRIRKEMGSDEILIKNWKGETPILALIEEILAQEKSLIGDKRDLILQYIGYDYLIK